MEVHIPYRVRTLKGEIEELIISCDKAQSAFVPIRALQKCLTPRKLHAIMDELDIESTYFDAIYNNCLVVFVILLHIGKAHEIPRFICHSHLFDERLPFDKEDRFKWPEECHPFFKDFYDRQWKFCVKIWEKGKLTGFEMPKNALLPIVEKDLLCNGSNSHTSTIVLHKEYNKLGPKTDVLVLKTYKRTDRNDQQSHQNEVRSYQILMRHEDIRPNILELHGHFQHGDDLNLILEYIDGGTLEEFYRSTSPPSAAQMLGFWTNFSQLFNPVFRMHTLRDKHRSQYYKATHQDIKPKNILVSRDKGSSDYVTAFKLIDFAFANFQLSSRHSDLPDYDQGGTKWYSAPELCRDDRVLESSVLRATVEIDTWSFGAVLSETLVWCVLGYTAGLLKYRDSRREATECHPRLERSGYVGCFHDGDHVLTVVAEMHKKAQAASEADSCTRILIDGMIVLAEDMLGASGTRISDLIVHQRFEKTLTKAFEYSRSQTKPEEKDKRSENAVQALFDQARSLRQPPPELPPDVVPSDSHYPNQAENSTGEDRVVFPSHNRNSLSSSHKHGILRSNSQSNHEANGKIPGPKVTFRPPKDSSEALSDDPPPTHSAQPGQESNTGQPAIKTIQDAKHWVSQWKRRSRRLAMDTASSSDVTKIRTKLKGRDQMFLFDDSETMKSHWSGSDGVIETFEVLGYLVKHCTSEGLHAYFGVSRNSAQRKNRALIVQKLINANPAGRCSMRFCLEKIVEQWWDENHMWLNKGFNKDTSNGGFFRRPKPKISGGLNLYVFTDGAWQESFGAAEFCGVDVEIQKIFAKMVENDVDLDTIRITFIHFGNHLAGSKRLTDLAQRIDDSPIPRDLVNVEPQRGNIQKMLFGSSGNPASRTVT